MAKKDEGVPLSNDRSLLDVVLEVGGLHAQPGHARQGTYFLVANGKFYAVQVTVSDFDYNQKPEQGKELEERA